MGLYIFDAVLLESGYNVANIYINARYKECHGWFQVVRTIKLLTVKKHDVIMANVFKRCLFLTVILVMLTLRFCTDFYNCLLINRLLHLYPMNNLILFMPMSIQRFTPILELKLY